MRMSEILQETKIDDFLGVKLWVNPTVNDLELLSVNFDLRGIGMTNGNIYVWNAFDALHNGIRYNKMIYDKEKTKFFLYISSDIKTKSQEWDNCPYYTNGNIFIRVHEPHILDKDAGKDNERFLKLINGMKFKTVDNVMK